MNRIIFFICFISATFAFSQKVVFNKVEKVHTNADKFLYRIDLSQNNAEYLGEIEVQGFSNDDAEIFKKIYKKAKEIGANAFAYQPFESIDGKSAFDPWNYKLKLYYLPKDSFPKEESTVYIFAPATEEQTIRFNKETITFKPRTFMKRKLKPGDVYKLSTRQLLGSSVQLTAQDKQQVQHFQLVALNVAADESGKGGLNFKSGDIILLEKSYAEFLSVIYQQF